jgi:hypothetical protein
MGKSRIAVTSGTATSPSVPVVSAGLGKLVTRAEAPSAMPMAAVSSTTLRVSLFAADLALTGGAVAAASHEALRGPGMTALAVLAVLFGAWLGWLALRWER